MDSANEIHDLSRYGLTTMGSPDVPTDAREPTVSNDSLTHAEGWYLVNVYWLSAAAETRVRTGELADRLGVSPASVTEMVAKLADASLLEYEKRGGVDLTPRGSSIAEPLAWRQCVVTSFFDRVLSYAVDGYTAYRIGHAVPESGVLRLREEVDHPCADACSRLGRRYDGCLVGTRVEG